MADVTWHATLVSRTPAASGPPTLTEVGFLPFHSIEWRRELNDPGGHDVVCETATLVSTIKTRLRNIKTTPSEIWLYRDGVMVAAGPLVQWVVDNNMITLKANGLLYYLNYLRRTVGYLSFAADQALQVKTLIDEAQALPWGHYGLNTTLLTAHGVAQSYGIKGELYDVVLDHVYKLGEYEDGFDLDVIPASREVMAYHPEQGTDLSTSASLDARTIIVPQISQAADAEAVASHAIVFGDDSTGNRHVVEQTNATFRAQWGLAHGVRTGQEFVDDPSATRAAQSVLVAGARRTEQISPTVQPAVGFGVDSVGLGDTITYGYDAGLGVEVMTRRILAITVHVEGESEQIGLTI